MRRRAFLLLMPAFAASVVAAQSPPDAKKARVLFIGNAITSAMELPGRVAKAAATTGRTVTVDSVAIDGYSLEDHWRQGDALVELMAAGAIEQELPLGLAVGEPGQPAGAAGRRIGGSGERGDQRERREGQDHHAP